MAVLTRGRLKETCAPGIPLDAQSAIVGGLAAIGQRRSCRTVNAHQGEQRPPGA